VLAAFSNEGVELVKKDFLAGVIALAEENPTKFVNLIRNGWPEIKAAMDQGHTLKVIHQRLAKGGVRISYRLFTLYVRQLLGKPRKPRGKSRKAELPTAPRVKTPSDSVAPVSAESVPHQVHEESTA